MASTLRCTNRLWPGQATRYLERKCGGAVQPYIAPQHLRQKEIRKAFKYRLYPSKNQSELLDRTLWLCREVYNAAIQERRDAWKRGVSAAYYEQKRSLVEAKQLVLELTEVHSQVLQDVVRRVDLAFQAFFRRVKNGESPGYPRFRGRYRYDSFTYPQAGETGAKPLEKVAKVYLPKVGNVRCEYHRPLADVVKTATVRREGEHWYVIFSCVVQPRRLPITGRVVAFDLGINPNFLIQHEGEPVRASKRWKRSTKKIAHLQKSRARKKRGSRRSKELRRQVRRESSARLSSQARATHRKRARRHLPREPQAPKHDARLWRGQHRRCRLAPVPIYPLLQSGRSWAESHAGRPGIHEPRLQQLRAPSEGAHRTAL